jgi:hypothetical protein
MLMNLTRTHVPHFLRKRKQGSMNFALQKKLQKYYFFALGVGWT